VTENVRQIKQIHYAHFLGIETSLETIGLLDKRTASGNSAEVKQASYLLKQLYRAFCALPVYQTYSQADRGWIKNSYASRLRSIASTNMNVAPYVAFKTFLEAKRVMLQVG
jgi:hypothetical protein